MNANEPSRVCPSCQKPLAPDTPLGLCPECLIKSGFATGTEPGTTGPGGSRFVAPSVEEVRKLFPHLEVIELIGRGGMGAVYKARQKELDRLVALKILPPGIGDDRAFADRFVREAKALAKLNHSNIVTLYEFDHTDGLFYFMMEFVDGVNLRQLLQAGRLAPREALAIVPQICDALQYAHDHGVVHRDIKPENILLDRKGRVKVADFGVARLMGIQGETPSGEGGHGASASMSLTEAGKVMGTPQYMAPEQVAQPAEVDHRADIYSLGVVFYQMLTGELPGHRIEPPSKKVLLDVRLDEVVLRALEKQPDLRYQQASELKTQVETIASGSASESEKVQPSQGLASADQTRFSRLAIAGALWIPVCFAISLMARLAVGSLHRSNTPSPHIALGIIILALGPVGMTSLGWLAVGQIRRSAGKLCGLGLALFDGLLFPLLALDFVVAGIAFKLLPNFRSEQLQWLEVAIVIGWIGLALALDAWISWKVWRAVNTNATPIQKPDRFWRRFAIVIVCAPLIVIAIVIAYLLLSREDSNFVRGQKGATLTSPDPKDARIHISLAKSLAQLGERDRAIAELRWALQLDPTSQEAKQLLQPLENSPSVSRQPDYAKALQLFRSADSTAMGLAEAIDKKDNPRLASGLASKLLQQLHAYNDLVAGTPAELPQEHIDELATVPEELKAGNWGDAKTALDDGLVMSDDLLSRLKELSEQQTQQSVQGVSLSAAKFDGPTGVAVDSSGNLYVADFYNQTIRKIATNGLVTTLAGNGLMIGPNGPEGGYADGPGTAARFHSPFGVAVDAAGNVYVGDFVNHAVRKISPTGVVSTLAGLPGTPGSSDGSGREARFRCPHGTAVDRAGNVYVADTDNDTIRKVTPSGMVITLAGKAGEHDSVDGRGGNARFNSPHGVAVDRAGSVFVADTDNHTIRRITPEGVVTTLAGTPRKKGSADGVAGKARFNGPFGVAVGDQGNLYVADTSNGTVRQIALAGTDYWVVTTVAELASTLDGLAVDGRGNIYVADVSNRTILKLTRAGTNWVVTDLLGKGPTRAR
jgi:serine/threonine protein kinase/sugar lactone lactonase YvrE